MNRGFGLVVVAMAMHAPGRPALDPLTGVQRMGAKGRRPWRKKNGGDGCPDTGSTTT
jgi:hypothetical protein